MRFKESKSLSDEKNKYLQSVGVRLHERHKNFGHNSTIDKLGLIIDDLIYSGNYHREAYFESFAEREKMILDHKSAHALHDNSTRKEKRLLLGAALFLVLVGLSLILS